LPPKDNPRGLRARIASVLAPAVADFRDLPEVWLRGSEQLTVDGCSAILIYEPDFISLYTSRGRLNITGRDMRLQNLSEGVLGVTGTVAKIEIEK